VLEQIGRLAAALVPVRGGRKEGLPVLVLVEVELAVSGLREVEVERF